MDPLSMERATTKISKHCPRAYRYKWGLENSYSNEITPEITPVKPICLKSIYRGHITPGGRPCRAFRLRSYERSNRQLVNHLSFKRGQTDCWSSLEIIPTPMAKQKGNTFFFWSERWENAPVNHSYYHSRKGSMGLIYIYMLM